VYRWLTYECVVTPVEVTCRDTTTGHGFTVSANTSRLF
jgi:hypothetical protein